MELWIERKSGGADVEKREEDECAKKNIETGVKKDYQKKLKVCRITC